MLVTVGKPVYPKLDPCETQLYRFNLKLLRVLDPLTKENPGECDAGLVNYLRGTSLWFYQLGTSAKEVNQHDYEGLHSGYKYPIRLKIAHMAWLSQIQDHFVWPQKALSVFYVHGYTHTHRGRGRIFGHPCRPGHREGLALPHKSI